MLNSLINHKILPSYIILNINITIILPSDVKEYYYDILKQLNEFDIKIKQIENAFSYEIGNDNYLIQIFDTLMLIALSCYNFNC